MSACAVRNLRLLGRRAFGADKHFIDAQAGHVIGGNISFLAAKKDGRQDLIVVCPRLLYRP